jgi:uncharacterized radical SAM superfamily Fe-S cluster-containing enzyme
MRLGSEPGYARLLAEAGLDSVYLQYDGSSDDIFRVLRGRPCLAEKMAAIRACAEAGLGVVLVATLVRGLNFSDLGNLLRLGLDMGTAVRGLHLQPAASFGRYPWPLAHAPRLTLPEIMAALADLSGGVLAVNDFHPPGCENALCSFSAVYRRDPSGGLARPKEKSSCGGAAPPHRKNLVSPPPSAEEGARASKNFIARHWSPPPADASPNFVPRDDFDRFLAKAGMAQRFTVSCMAFQDAMNLDLERVRGCCIHVVNAAGLLIPFCLYNLTAVDGTALYREN